MIAATVRSVGSISMLGCRSLTGMSSNMLLGLVRVEESASGDTLTWNVREDVGHEDLQPFSHSVIYRRLRAREPREYVVVDLIVLELLHETDDFTVNELACSKRRVHDDETVNITAIIGRRVDDEPVRKRVGSRHSHGALPDEPFLVVVVLLIRPRLRFG